MVRTMGRKGRYLKHGRKGKITDNQSQKTAIAADSRKKAKTVVKPGYGYKGDQKRKTKKFGLFGI